MTIAFQLKNNQEFQLQRKSFGDLFQEKPIVGALHLLPLPGAPLYDGDFSRVIDVAVKEAEIYAKNGVHAISIENFRDFPFYPGPVGVETVAAMTVIGNELKRKFKIPLGVNVLRSDSKAALAIATAVKASFIRVNVHMGAIVSEQGVISGLSHEILRYRESLQSDVLIFADIGVKHAAQLANRGLGTEAQDVEQRGLADAIIVSGPLTGKETSLEDVQIARKNSSLPILLGSGTSPENMEKLFEEADGAFVGSYFKYDGRGRNLVDAKRVKKFMDAYKKIK